MTDSDIITILMDRSRLLLNSYENLIKAEQKALAEEGRKEVAAAVKIATNNIERYERERAKELAIVAWLENELYVDSFRTDRGEGRP